jgi:hypothetical protein
MGKEQAYETGLLIHDCFDLERRMNSEETYFHDDNVNPYQHGNPYR